VRIAIRIILGSKIGIRNDQQLREITPGADWVLSQEELVTIDQIVGTHERFDHLALGAQFRPN
jgi:hypothetical protein